MPYSAEDDPLCYAGTAVLINLLNLTDPLLLEEAEMAAFFVRARKLPVGELDLPHYRALHRHLFQDVYAWAGEFRTIRTGKAGNWFCYPEYIEPELRRVFAELGDIDLLETMQHDAFATHIAHFLAELNAVHPFREGNGRTQLTFVAMLAERAGFGFDASQLNPDRMMAAMIESFSGDELSLTDAIRDLLR